jgi:hypothetical protein
VAILLGTAVVALLSLVVSPTQASNAAPYLGLVHLGMPSAPQPFMPSDFAITKHFRQSGDTAFNNGYGPPATAGNQPMDVQHGANCAPPPATHPIGGQVGAATVAQMYAEMVFVCHDHLMTALNGNGGYGELAFQPNQLVDFSGGATAQVALSMSTQRTSDRDWITWHFTPFANQLAVPVAAADGQGDAANDLVVQMCSNGDISICAYEMVGGVRHDIATNWWLTAAQFTPPSATVRTPIRFAVSQTHLTVTIAGGTFIDTALPVALPWDHSIFQVVHHSYTPTKDGGTPDTWHWSNLTIDRAVPYFLSMGMPEAAGDSAYGLGSHVTFSQPAPTGAFVRFQAFYNDVQVSFDGGATWRSVNNQPANDQHLDHALNVWLSVPAGAQQMRLRGAGDWYARDFYLMAANGASASTSAPIAARMPLDSAPVPAPMPINSPLCMVMINDATRASVCGGRLGS